MAISGNIYLGGSSANTLSWSQKHKHVVIAARKTLGFLLTINFLVFWAVPIFLQGGV